MRTVGRIAGVLNSNRLPGLGNEEARVTQVRGSSWCPWQHRISIFEQSLDQEPLLSRQFQVMWRERATRKEE